MTTDRRYTPAELAEISGRWSFADPLRPPATDEEPWLPADPDPQRGVSLLDAAVVGSGLWVYAVAIVATALLAVLVVLGIRKLP